jgi:ligand-binding sensor domain-containing protein/signal transduction histidine kinase
MNGAHPYSRWLLKAVFFTIVSLWCTHVHAQLLNLEFETYNTTKGLSQNLVYSIAQDKSGFLWIGTDDGLNRFDGYDFKIFRSDKNDPHTLPDNSIRALCMAGDSTLWIGTNNGVCRYFPRTETFERFPMDAKIAGASVSDIKIRRDSSVWIAYIGNGVNVVYPRKKEVLHYGVNSSPPHKLKSDLIANILFMPDGDVLLGTLAGLDVINKNGSVLTDAQALAKYPWKDSIDPSIRSIVLSRDRQTVWIGTELQGLYQVDLKTHRVENYNKWNSALDFSHVLSLYEDSRGNLWVGSEAIYLFDKAEKTLIPYNEYGIPGSIVIRNPVYSMFEDKDKNMWMGTFRLGILKYTPLDTRILHYHTNRGEGSIENNEILSFSQDRHGDVWIGTGGAGIYKLQQDLKGFERPALNSSFSSQVIKCIYKDRRGNFWLGTWEGGFMRYNPDDEELDIYSLEKKNFASSNVWDIREDHVGNLWLATLRYGLCYFSPATEKYSFYTHSSGDSTSLINNDVLSLYIDTRQNLWVGTGNGLSVKKNRENGFMNFRHTGKGKAGEISSNVILCFYEDKAGRIWMGTNGGGITIMNKDFTVAKIITEADGLPSGTVASLQPDDHNNLWVSTYNGLARIDQKTMAITEVPQIIGLQGREFIPRSNFKDSRGRLFFGGINGFNLFHPDSLVFSPLHGNVVLTSLKIQNQEIVPATVDGSRILDRSITETDKIRLSHEDYSFTISFSPLVYNWQRSLHYAYFLENLDKEWQYTTSDRRFVHYTNLAPGEYVLKVKASFDGKRWPEEARTLKIIVYPPWWATAWFKVLAFLLIASLLYVFYRMRVGFLGKQKDKLEKLVDIRTTELKKSNAEIKILLQQVASQRDSIEEKNHELQQINEALGAQRDSLEEKSAELETAQTKLKEINEDLEKLVSERTQKLNDTVMELETFLYRASHDIRGPITSMLGLIEMARIEPDHQKFYSLYNDFLRKTVLQLDRTLQKLLEKHIIEKNDVVYETIDKATVLKLLNTLLKNISYYRPDCFVLSVEENTAIKTDRMLFSVLLGNLLENAFFFSTDAENKMVHLDIKRNGNSTHIMVKDHGPGISHSLKDKIFDMFYRGNVLSSGNGLGLYLVKCALKKINGSIDLETQEGSYSSFLVTLPD